ncbi:MAG: serine/threonine dehydratase [Acidimicrobiales bacterium]
MPPDPAATHPLPDDMAALPSRSDIEAAAQRLAPWIRVTPLIEVDAVDLGLPDGRRPLALKLEMLQHAGSFKGRGAHNQLLGEVPAAGVVAASGGNYGVAVAYAAHRLGVPATVFVTDTTAPAKLDRLRSLGATVEVVAGYYDEALAASHEHAAATGARFLHAFDQPEMLEGAGTLAAELERQATVAAPRGSGRRGLDRVIVAVGGAGLIGGVACWCRGRVRITGVETRGCRGLDAAWRAGGPVDTEVSGLAADALGARRVGELGYAAARAWAEGVVVVEDADVVDAQRRLWRALRLATEPAGAAALAALTTGALPADPDERIAVVLCGANVDPGTLL